MKEKNEVPFLYCRLQQASFFSFSQETRYYWSDEEEASALDYTPLLMGRYKEKIPCHHKLIRRIDQFLEHSPNLVSPEKTRYKKIKIDLQKLGELDSYLANALYYNSYAELAQGIVSALSDLLLTNTVGFNFRECFYVPEGQTPPGHCRPDIDLCVSNLEEYQSCINKPSYQLGLLIFSKFAPDSKPASVTDSLILRYLRSGNLPTGTIRAESTPISEYHFYNASLACILHQRSNIIPITDPLQVGELWPVFQLQGMVHKEYILVLEGAKYANEEERNQLTTKLYNLSCMADKNPFYLRVVFITSRNLNLSLVDLLACIKVKDSNSRYQASPDSSCFYLSDPMLSINFYSYISSGCRNLKNHLNLPTEKKCDALKTYHIAQSPHNAMRQSKKLDTIQTKGNVRLVLSQQTTVSQNQNQAFNQEQQQTCTTEVNQQTSLAVAKIEEWNWKFYWSNTVDFQEFCEAITQPSHMQREYLSKAEDSLTAHGFFTQFYLENFSLQAWHQKIIEDEAFRVEQAAKAFGLALVKDKATSKLLRVSIPDYSVDRICNPNAFNHLYYWFRPTLDGLFSPAPNQIISKSPIQGRVLLKHDPRDNWDPNFFWKYDSNLLYSLRKKNKESKLIPVFNYCSLLPNSAHFNKPIARKEAIAIANNLLALFEPHEPCTPEEINALEADLLSIVRHLTEYQPYYSEQFKKFMEGFEEHNEDNIKILLYMIIDGYRDESIIAFTDLLSYLDSPLIRESFYKLYFKYATNVNSVRALISNPMQSPFLSLVRRLPGTHTAEPLSPLDRLCLDWMLFYAKNGVAVTNEQFDALREFWSLFRAQCLPYFGDSQATDLCLDNLVQNLSGEEGLAIEALRRGETFLQGLQYLLERALSRHTLEEQIREIRGISFMALDAPLACVHNGFDLICPEMRIRSLELNPVTKSYKVSRQELLDAITAHQPGDSYLKTAVFRYLGTERIREDLAFYRALYERCFSQANEAKEIFLAETLWAFYTATYTGSDYAVEVDEPEFAAKCLRFMGFRIASEAELSQAIRQFFIHLNALQRHQDRGTVSLWSIWRENRIAAFKTAETPIPSIFFRQFTPAKLGYFLVTQNKALRDALPALLPSSEAASALIAFYCRIQGLEEPHGSLVVSYLNRLFPGFDMAQLLDNSLPVKQLIELLAPMLKQAPDSLLYSALDAFLNQNCEYPDFIALLEIVSLESDKQHFDANAQRRITQFILNLSTRPVLCEQLSKKSGLFACLLEFYIGLDSVASPDLLFTLFVVLIPLEEQKARVALKQLFPLFLEEHGLAFFERQAPFDAGQIQDICLLQQRIPSQNLLLNVLDLYFQQTHVDAKPLLQKLSDKDLGKNERLLELACLIAKQQNSPLLTVMTSLLKKTDYQLKQLRLLQKIHAIPIEKLALLVEQEDLDAALIGLEKSAYESNQDRYDYEPADIRDKIARIKVKDPYSDADIALSNEVQTTLFEDYRQLMSYLHEKPVQPWSDKAIKELDFKGCQALFLSLKESMRNPGDKHQEQLVVLALCCEVLYRSTRKFPRSTQILSLLNLIHDPHNLIHQIKTGEGKSIVSAMHAVLFYSMNKTVDVITENNELARNALDKFGALYEYLGIPYASRVIVPDSAYKDYLQHGINYSTAANLALFRSAMAFAKQEFPRNTVLIADEIDAALTTTVQFRLASVLRDTNMSASDQLLLYKLVLEFVKEKALYKDNSCSAAEDLINLRAYCITNNPKKPFVNAVAELSNELLDTLIESACITHALEENVDFYVVEKQQKKDTVYYAAPIISSTKRPDPAVSYSEHVQQLLHALLRDKGPKRRFDEEACAITLMVTSAKNFFDYYRLQGGLIIGLTGTAGSTIERSEFWELQGLRAYSYPTFYPDLALDLGLIACFGAQAHSQTIKDWLLQHRAKEPSQAVLIITSSPQSSSLLFAQLRDDSKKTQRYHGYEELGRSEDQVIQSAGKSYYLTIANQSLARGADVEPEDEEKGLLVINTCLDLTPSELLQIQGRVGRNGKPGQFLSIINAETIATKADSPAVVAQAFRDHQYTISLRQQAQRKKTRLLEEVRFLIVSKYLLEFRSKADALLAPVLGSEFSLASEDRLSKLLTGFNKEAELHYDALMGSGNELDAQGVETFLLARIAFQNKSLKQMLASQNPPSLTFISPQITIAVLQNLNARLKGQSLEQFVLVSRGVNALWLKNGHMAAYEVWAGLDKVTGLFAPYYQGQVSFKQNLGQIFESKGDLTPESIEHATTLVNQYTQEFLDAAKAMPVIGHLLPENIIKKCISDYTEQVKKQLINKEYDAITWPQLDPYELSSWFAAFKQIGFISQLMVIGPVTMLLNAYLLPFIRGKIKAYSKAAFANSESALLQFLLGLDEFFAAIARALDGLLDLCKVEQPTIGMFLDSFRPLMVNKAGLITLGKYLELSGHEKYLPYLQLIPEIFAELENYREYNPKVFIAENKWMELLHKLFQSERNLALVQQSPFASLLESFIQCKPEFIQLLCQLQPNEFIPLMQVLAHPEFFSMMEKMPSDTSMDTLCGYLANPPESLSPAMASFIAYQTNRELESERRKRALQELQRQYTLTLPLLRSELEALKPKLVKQGIGLESATKAPAPAKWQFGLGEVFRVVVILSLVVYAFMHFSLAVVAASLILSGIFLYPYLEAALAGYSVATEKPAGTAANSPVVEKNTEVSKAPENQAQHPGLHFFARQEKQAASKSELSPKAFTSALHFVSSSGRGSPEGTERGLPSSRSDSFVK